MKKPTINVILPDADDYEIGYKRPPKDKQFVPGTSGNPKGRRKGRKNVATIITEIAMQPVTITEGGRPRTVPRVVAFMLTLWMQAFKGNPKAWTAILHYLREVGMLQAEPEPGEQPITDDDQAIIADFVKKLPLNSQASKKGTRTIQTIKKPGLKRAPEKKV